MGFATMTGDYFDPDSTDPIIMAGYAPCDQGMMLMFDPVAGDPPVRANVSFIGRVDPVRNVLKVTSLNTPNISRILGKEKVDNPSIDLYTYRIHNMTETVEGRVSVRAEMIGNVKHVYIEP